MSRSRDFQFREFKAIDFKASCAPPSSIVIGTSRCTFQSGSVTCAPLDLRIPEHRADLELPEYKEQKSRPKQILLTWVLVLLLQ